LTSALNPKERLDWLRLARTESVGPVTFAHLIARYGAASEVLRALPTLARRGGRTQTPRIPSIAEAQAELDAGAAAGARLIAGCEDAYPRALKALDAPPPVLWTLGDATLLTREMVAVVGARAASAAGRRFARHLAAGLAEAGWVVVSGMARGIDAAAHEGALPGGTVAAGEQGREVFAVPGSPLDPRSRGTNDLIRQGATLVEGVDDVLRVLLALPGLADAPPAPPVSTGVPGARIEATSSALDAEALADILDGLLSFTPTSVNVLARDAGAPVSAVLAALTELALAGRAELAPGNLAVKL